MSNIWANVLKTWVGFWGVEYLSNWAISSFIEWVKNKVALVTEPVTNKLWAFVWNAAPFALWGIWLYKWLKEKWIVNKVEKATVYYGPLWWVFDFPMWWATFATWLGIKWWKALYSLAKDWVEKIPELPWWALNVWKKWLSWLYDKTLGKVFSKSEKKAG